MPSTFKSEPALVVNQLEFSVEKSIELIILSPLMSPVINMGKA